MSDFPNADLILSQIGSDEPSPSKSQSKSNIVNSQPSPILIIGVYCKKGGKQLETEVQSPSQPDQDCKLELQIQATNKQGERDNSTPLSEQTNIELPIAVRKGIRGVQELSFVFHKSIYSL